MPGLEKVQNNKALRFIFRLKGQINSSQARGNTGVMSLTDKDAENTFVLKGFH